MPILTVGGIISPKFVDAITTLYGLSSLRTGRHVLRDGRGWKSGEMIVHRFWLAEIKPSFADEACLAVLDTDGGLLITFCVERESALVAIGPFVSFINDPLEDVLQRFDAWSVFDGISLDGIGYNLYFGTHAVQLAMSFVNPSAPSFVAIERAVVDVANSLSLDDMYGIVNEYLQDWLPYTYLRST